MLFDSPVYFVFLVPVVCGVLAPRHRPQNVFLLFASYFFYAWWDWRFLALMIGSTTMDFVIARKLADPANPSRRAWFISSLVINFAVLGVFKYFNFFVDSMSNALAMLGVHDIPCRSSMSSFRRAFRSTRSRKWPTSSTSTRAGSSRRDRLSTTACSSVCFRT